MTGGARFLDPAGWSGAEVETIASDASDRSYRRLRRGDGTSAILMQAPVATSDVAARQFAAFRRVAAWLREQHLAAPGELAADPGAGLLLLEDLGDLPLSRLIDTGSGEARAGYGAAVSVLARLAGLPPPAWLERPGAPEIAAMVDLTFSLLPGSEAFAAETRGILAEHLRRLDTGLAVALRDVHGDNLIWRPERAGTDRVGLLDFQDALVLPDGYDLASLVDDPRRTVPDALREALVQDFAAARGQDLDDLRRRVALLSVLRNLRILGIFRRLATERGRTDYARFLPRTRILLARGAAHPDLSALQPLVTEVLDRTAQWQAVAA